MTSFKIVCPALRGEKITPQRCRIKAAEELKFWGERAPQMNGGCPCDDRSSKGAQMAYIKDGVKKYYKRIGTCPDCGRSELRLYGCEGRDVCGACKTVVSRKKEWPRRVDDVVAKSPDMPKGEDPREAEYVGTGSQRETTSPAIGRAIVINIGDDIDSRIFEFLTAEAKRCRRTVDQQAMWMLQSYLPESRGEGSDAAKSFYAGNAQSPAI